MFDKIAKFVKTIGDLDLKKLISVFVLISMISGGIFWLQTSYVSANDFEVYAMKNDYNWAVLKLEKINDQIYYWAVKVDKNPNDGYAQKKLMEFKQKEQIWLDKIKLLEQQQIQQKQG